MSMKERPSVETLKDGGKVWGHSFARFDLKVYVPKNDLDGQVNNYGFKAPLLVVLEDEKKSMEEAVSFANSSGLAKIAADYDSSVLFVSLPVGEVWENQTEALYQDLIAEVRMITEYEDGICPWNDFFSGQFRGFYVRGAIFRTDIYSYGKSADYVARNLLQTIHGEYLWGPGEITPAMCSMEGLSVVPTVERKDIGIVSVGNSSEVNAAFSECKDVLIKEHAEYEKDFYRFIWKFKMWCGQMEYEPDLKAMGLNEVAGSVTVTTSPDNKGRFKDQPTHKVGYFAYYNEGLFDNGPVPLLVGMHGGGDSSMYLTYVAGWYEIANRYNFLFVSIENHLDVTATEIVEVIRDLQKKYNIDEKRIYATGFSMGSGKTTDLFQEYPELLAGCCPASALFPLYDNNLGGKSLKDGINENTPVPIFYSGGEESPLPELPFQAPTCVDRAAYFARVNGCKTSLEVDFSNKENWENPIWGKNGDRVEKFYDESRGSTLTVQYFDSEDGVCRTAFASVSGQQHECRHHTCEVAWQFISKFHR